MDASEVERYWNRDLKVIRDGGLRVAVFDGDREVYSTAANFADQKDALRAARALVDQERAGHSVTPPTNDPAGSA